MNRANTKRAPNSRARYAIAISTCSSIALNSEDAKNQMTFWDQQFSGDAYKYGTQPNIFLVEQISRVEPGGKILLPGDGEGRNSAWLAERGFEVTAMDNSKVGLEKALKLSKKHGVTIQTIHADLQDWVPEPESMHAVALIFVHLPPALRTVVIRRMLGALKRGGLLLVEAFHPRQLGLPSGGPKVLDMLYTLSQLRAEAQTSPVMGTQELLAEEIATVLNEGLGHQGPAFVTRWVLSRT